MKLVFSKSADGDSSYLFDLSALAIVIFLWLLLTLGDPDMYDAIIDWLRGVRG